jgi:hypothetical protein
MESCLHCPHAEIVPFRTSMVRLGALDWDTISMVHFSVNGHRLMPLETRVALREARRARGTP